MPTSTWHFSVRFKLKNSSGSTMTSSYSHASVKVNSHQNNPTEFEKMQALKEYIESRHSGWNVVDMNITDCHH